MELWWFFRNEWRNSLYSVIGEPILDLYGDDGRIQYVGFYGQDEEKLDDEVTRHPLSETKKNVKKMIKKKKLRCLRITTLQLKHRIDIHWNYC